MKPTEDYQSNLYLIDTWMLQDRYKEEISITLNEQMNYLESTKSRITELEKEVLQYSKIAKSSYSEVIIDNVSVFHV
jgi:hypothetical protein